MYAKGASLLHTIRRLVNNDEKWRRVLRGPSRTFYHQVVTGSQVEHYLSAQTGIRLDHVFDEYLRTTMVPTLEYRIAAGTLFYRWSNVVPGFAMPVRVRLRGDDDTLIRPTESWQKTPTTLTERAELQVDKGFYVASRSRLPSEARRHRERSSRARAGGPLCDAAIGSMIVGMNDVDEERGGVLALGVLSVAIGAWTGVVVALFRLGLSAASHLRNALLAAAHHWSAPGFAAVIAACTGAVVLAAWLARRLSPYAEGSGIPEVEVALEQDLPPMPLPRLLLVKFVGGILALGSGMALGPEGPSVQMGAVGARLIGRRFRRAWPDLHSLIAAGTGAGLAVAFNAPIAGAVFVLEELHRKFESRAALAALGASSAAVLVANLIVGNAPLFHVAGMPAAPSAGGFLPYEAPATLALYVLLGLVAGLLGALYNRALISALDLAERFDRRPGRPWAVAVGVAVGVIGWFAPAMIGPGEALTQEILAGAAVASAVPLVFLLRFCFGAASYGVRAPGGLFAPLLLLGAQLGVLGGALAQQMFPALGVHPQAFAVIGMAAFFVGVVRAPVTGIVLVIEMTAAFTTLLPMLAASFAAMVAADLTGTAPIYTTLRERLVARVRGGGSR